MPECNHIADCAKVLGRGEDYVRSTIGKLIESNGGNDKAAFATCANVVDILCLEGDELGATIMASIARAIRGNSTDFPFVVTTWWI
jgi:hypothetical protein